MFYEPKVYGMLLAIVKSNEYVKGEDEPFVKSYPYKNVKIKKEYNRALCEEFRTDLQDRYSPSRFGDSKEDIVIKKLVKYDEE